MQNRLPDVNVQLIPTPLVFVDRTSILPILFTFADRIHDLISVPLSFFQSPSKEKASPQSNCSSQSDDQVITQQKNCLMSREEVRFVMDKLELFCSKNDGDEEIGECFGGEELTAMFEENEPSLEELKQTFNVFDRNRDGFIDAEELHIVLGLLQSNNGIFIHDCKRMIARFDHNNDGKIDFTEFVKFMEVALS
ncbi:probable calcium-binding protein CML45 [Benincasa hispida]|uniref:probable calcium-binding protein CML45 n=1 Tax=Benincasa hispida TaxID=102211 RepID=UPI0019029B13|nr:probable calcium-binding protein CML45 [Benincasa hispida]